MNSPAATSALVWPAATRSATLCSAAVRTGPAPRRGACPDPGQLAEDAVLPPRGAEPFEDRQRRPEEIQRLLLVPRPPVNLTGGQKRPCFLERHRQAAVRLKSRVQRGPAPARSPRAASSNPRHRLAVAMPHPRPS